MFAIRQRTKVARGVQRAMEDILKGRFATPDECEQICSSTEGAAWLWTEAMVHVTNALAFVIEREFRHQDWANAGYFVENARRATKGSEQQLQLLGVILRGLDRLGSISGEGQDRFNSLLEHSAELVLQREEHVDRRQVAELLNLSVQRLLDAVSEYLPPRT